MNHPYLNPRFPTENYLNRELGLLAFNLTQQPAITVPCGLTKDGLPIGLQIVGPMFGDALVLRAARAFESARPVLRPNLGALQ